ncbi:MAG: CYTH domain-containing protein [Myxococcota bacterium]|nr:CYTH domain-containing protein [Myxococcota bacterium]
MSTQPRLTDRDIGAAMERELKMALEGSTDLEKILKRLPKPEEIVEQRNHYFVDPPMLLSSVGMMVRVREERSPDAPTPHLVILTLKRRVSASDGVFVAHEEETLLDHSDWAEVQSGDRDLVSLPCDALKGIRDLGVSRLDVRGTMVNLRRKISLGGFLLEVDQTTFPNGVVDSEIEVETDRPEEARAMLEEVAREVGITLRVQTRGKYGRLLKHLERSGQ